MERTIDSPEYPISSDPISRLAKGGFISFRKIYKVIFKLSREKCCTYKEIADILKISQGTVEKQMSKALHSLTTSFSADLKITSNFIAYKKIFFSGWGYEDLTL